MHQDNFEDDAAADTLWGVEEIAKFVGAPIRKCYYLIERGKLPVRKLSHRTIVASKAQLREALVADVSAGGAS